MATPGKALLASRISFARQIRLNASSATRQYHALRLSSPTLLTTTSSRFSKPTKPQPGTPLQRRNFSAISALETTLTTTQHLFTELHHLTGTPWYLTIPLIALSINLIARFPLSVYSRRIAIQRAKLSPLFQAWRQRHMREVGDDPRTRGMPRPKREAEVVRRMKTTSKRIYKAWGVQRYKDFVGLGVFPVWLVGIEALRRLCGGPRGLLGTLVFGAKEEVKEGTGEAVAPAASSNSVEAVSVVDVIRDVVPAGADPSLATGGCLWFPDLMAADPLHILPFALSAVLVLNILPRSQSGMRRLFGLQDAQMGMVESKTPERLMRVFLLMAVAIGPATLDLPAAIHLYWLASSTTTLIQTELLSKLMPIPKPTIKPCRGNETLLRPTRPKKQGPQGS